MMKTSLNCILITTAVLMTGLSEPSTAMMKGYDTPKEEGEPPASNLRQSPSSRTTSFAADFPLQAGIQTSSLINSAVNTRSSATTIPLLQQPDSPGKSQRNPLVDLLAINSNTVPPVHSKVPDSSVIDVALIPSEFSEAFSKMLQGFKDLSNVHPDLQLLPRSPICFISYAWGEAHQEQLVHTLAEHLKEAGLNVLLDIWHNTGGTQISTFAEKIITEADMVILTGSNNLMKKSRQQEPSVVKVELDMIFQKFTGKRGTIFPIVLEADHRTVLPPFLWNTVSVDFKKAKSYDQSCFKLLQLLYGLTIDDPYLKAIGSNLSPIPSPVIQKAAPSSPSGTARSIRTSSSSQEESIQVIRKGTLSDLQGLILQGLDVHKVDAKGRSLLQRAAHEGRMNMVGLLIENGADVNHTDDLGNTALYMACLQGHVLTAEKLLDTGAAIDQADHRGITALHIAVQKGHIAVVKLLCQRGASVQVTSIEGQQTPLMIATRKKHQEMIGILIQYGAQL